VNNNLIIHYFHSFVKIIVKISENISIFTFIFCYNFVGHGAPEPVQENCVAPCLPAGRERNNFAERSRISDVLRSVAEQNMGRATAGASQIYAVRRRMTQTL